MELEERDSAKASSKKRWSTGSRALIYVVVALIISVSVVAAGWPLMSHNR